VLMDQSSRDDTLVGIGSPGAAPAGAVSSQSSRDKRRERSAGGSSIRGEGRAISVVPLAQNDSLTDVFDSADWSIAGNVGLLLLVVAAIELLGMALTAVLVSAALPLLWGERRYRILIPFAILFPVAVTLLFTQVLKIYFEPGKLALGFG